ncbi:AAA family ATPase [Kitasatospora sp. NPDC004531]
MLLYGRGTELAAVGRLLAEAGAGRAGVLVLRGEPGVGKSALLAAAAESAPGRVLRATGVESEARLPYAALSQLLAPVLDRVPELPGPQRAALERVLGLADGPAADRLLVGLAVLTLLGELAEQGPLLCLVDDVQWADRESVAVLQVAARRLGAEAVALLLATRADGPELPGLPEAWVEPLDERAAAELLAAVAPELANRAAVLAAAQGNPLALVELSAAGAAGGLPPAGRLRLAYHGQLSRLPGATQRWLLLAALEESGAPEVLLRAAGECGLTVADLAPAEQQGLVRVELGASRVTFRHPLLRSVLVDRAPLVDRLAAHAALARAYGGREPLRRAWHLALAATGRDAAVAEELASAAAGAASRGGHTGASAAYERAARLSPDAARARELTVEAVEAALEAGEVGRAEALAAAADAPGLDPVTRAHLLFARGVAEFWRGEHRSAHRRLTEAAALVADAAPGPATRVLVQALHAAWYLDVEAVCGTLTALGALALPADDPLAPAVRYVTAALGDAPDGPTLAEAERAARAAGAVAPVDLALPCGAALLPGQDEEVLDLAGRLVREAREAGAFGTLPTLLFFLAEAELFTGRPEAADEQAGEALRLAEDCAQPLWTGQLHGFLAYLAATRGEDARCREHAGGPAPAAPPGCRGRSGRWACWSSARAAPRTRSGSWRRWPAAGRTSRCRPSVRCRTWWRRRCGCAGRRRSPSRWPGSSTGHGGPGSRGRGRWCTAATPCWPPRSWRRSATWRRWPGTPSSPARGSRPAPSCCTASGCGGPAAGPRPGRRCAPPSRHCVNSARCPGRSGPDWSWTPPARPPRAARPGR